MEIKIEIKKCSECPFFKEERVYTADSFEIPFDWFCKKAHGRKIAGYVEWHDKIAIPDWCPCRIDKPTIETLQKKIFKSNVVYFNGKICKNRYGAEEIIVSVADLTTAEVESWDGKEKVLRLITK